MKKSLIALAVMAAAGAASAQSSVTLFGIVDATFMYGRASGGGGNTLWQLGNSGYNSSRLGFRGVEDLGGGMSASFWLEGGLSNDDGRAGGTILAGNMGAATTGNPSLPAHTGNQGFNFNRKAHVSLSSPMGELRIGRDYSASFWNLTVFDPFGTNGSGTTLTLLGPVTGNTYGAASAAAALVPGGTAGPAVRVGNSINWFLPPNLGGIYGQLQFYLGENLRSEPTNAGNKRDGSGIGLRLGYGAGPLNIAASWQSTAYATTFATTAFNSRTTGDYTTWNIGGQWDLGMAKIMGQYVQDERESAIAVDGKGWLIGALVPVGPGEIRASYSQYRIDTGVAGASDPRSRKLALGYVHNLSKRTAVYATIATVRNNGGAASVVNGAANTGSTWGVNQSSMGWDLGVRHSF